MQYYQNPNPSAAPATPPNQDTQEYSFFDDAELEEDFNGPHVGGLLRPIAPDGSQEELLVMTRDDLASSSGYIIGRHPTCHHSVDHTAVSNRHCRIRFQVDDRTDSCPIIVDDLSTNGTFINDRLIGKGQFAFLQDGDTVSVTGVARLIFHRPIRRREGAEFSKHYALLQPLGSGTFATVYMARHRGSGRPFAVKKFTLQSPDKNNQLAGIMQEISVLKAVSHPNLLCMIDSFKEDDGFYLVLEYAPAGDLFKYVTRKQKLSDRRARPVFIQICDALRYLHEHKIIHRDIKLENILLLDSNPTVKLADFGLAKIIGEKSFTSTLCGTPDYVAPEVITPSVPRRYTQAVDLWSLGVVLYVILCGFPPFSEQLYTAENPYRMSDQIIMGRYFFPSPYWDSVDDSAIDLVNGLLCVNPSDRMSVEDCQVHPWVTRASRTGRVPPAPMPPFVEYYYGDVNEKVQMVPRGNGPFSGYLDSSQRRRTMDMYREPMQLPRPVRHEPIHLEYHPGNDDPLYSFEE